MQQKTRIAVGAATVTVTAAIASTLSAGFAVRRSSSESNYEPAIGQMADLDQRGDGTPHAVVALSGDLRAAFEMSGDPEIDPRAFPVPALLPLETHRIDQTTVVEGGKARCGSRRRARSASLGSSRAARSSRSTCPSAA